MGYGAPDDLIPSHLLQIRIVALPAVQVSPQIRTRGEGELEAPVAVAVHARLENEPDDEDRCNDQDCQDDDGCDGGAVVAHV